MERGAPSTSMLHLDDSGMAIATSTTIQAAEDHEKVAKMISKLKDRLRQYKHDPSIRPTEDQTIFMQNLKKMEEMDVKLRDRLLELDQTQSRPRQSQWRRHTAAAAST